jgi:uncharacterized membrane protein
VGRKFALIVFSLGAASVLSIATLVVRTDKTHNYHYTFLVWNLFLAWVPLIAAYFAFSLARRGISARVGVLLVVWLLFFPNAPYMLTDFKHLHEPGHGKAPLWYDALMLTSFAWTALMLGFTSLYLVHAIVVRRVRASVGWVAVVCVLGLSSFGIYLGRFAGFNSWDAVAHPRILLSGSRQELDSLLHEPRMLAALLALTAFLFVGYLVLYAFSALGLELAERVTADE